MKYLLPSKEEADLLENILKSNDKLNKIFNNLKASEERLVEIKSKIKLKKLGKLKAAKNKLMNDINFLNKLDQDLKDLNFQELKSKFEEPNLSFMQKLKDIFNFNDLNNSVDELKKSLNKFKKNNNQLVSQIDTSIKKVEPNQNETKPDEMDVDTDGIEIDESLKIRKSIKRPGISEENEKELKRQKVKTNHFRAV